MIIISNQLDDTHDKANTHYIHNWFKRRDKFKEFQTNYKYKILFELLIPIITSDSSGNINFSSPAN